MEISLFEKSNKQEELSSSCRIVATSSSFYAIDVVTRISRALPASIQDFYPTFSGTNVLGFRHSWSGIVASY